MELKITAEYKHETLDKALSQWLSDKIPNIKKLVFPTTTFSLKLVVDYDDGYQIFQPKWRWFARAHYLVLRKSRRSRCRPLLRI